VISISRIRNFWIFPVTVMGNCSTKRTYWVRLKANQESSEEEIRKFCEEKIAYFKIPQYVRFVEQFPMTVTGKIQKFRIREIEITDRGLETVAKRETA